MGLMERLGKLYAPNAPRRVRDDRRSAPATRPNGSTLSEGDVAGATWILAEPIADGVAADGKRGLARAPALLWRVSAYLDMLRIVCGRFVVDLPQELRAMTSGTP